MTSYIARDSPLIALLSGSAGIPTENTNLSINELNQRVFQDVEYSEAEKTEVSRWLTTAGHIASAQEDNAKTAERLLSLNSHLSTRSTLLGSKPSIADVAMFTRLAPVVKNWTIEERTGSHGYHHIVRHIDFVQNAPLFHLNLSDGEKVQVDEADIHTPIPLVDLKAEKERKKREKEATSFNGDITSTMSNPSKDIPIRTKGNGKGEVADTASSAITPGVTQGKPGKKQKAPKAAKQQPPSTAPALSPALIDLRVGHILKAEAHPNADSLYVSTVACGDAPGTENTSEYEGQTVRTVCSGLRAYMPLDNLQGRKIVAVCNLKPVTMRGVKSCAMVLAASPRVEEGGDSHAGPVELVNVPEAAKAGDRVFFEGWEGEPEKVLNPKKKIWETCQAGFTTTEKLEVAFDAAKVEDLLEKDGVAKLKTSTGICTVHSLRGATVR